MCDEVLLVEAVGAEVERLRMRQEVVNPALLVDLVELGVEVGHVDRRRGRAPPASRFLHDLCVGRVVRVVGPRLQIGADVEALRLARIVARDDVPGRGEPLVDEVEVGAVAAGIAPGPDERLRRPLEDHVARSFELGVVVVRVAEGAVVLAAPVGLRPVARVGHGVRAELVAVVDRLLHPRPEQPDLQLVVKPLLDAAGPARC